MSSGRIDRLLKSTGFRLTAWYVVVFAASLLVVAAVAQYIIARVLESRERALITAHLYEYRTEYEARGISGLSQAVLAHEAKNESESVLLSDGPRTLYERAPHPDRDGNGHREPPGGPAPSLESRPGNDGRIWRVGETVLSGSLHLQVGRSRSDELELLGHVRDASLAALAVALVPGLVGGALFTRRALRPVRQLSNAMQTIIRSGKLDERVPTSGRGDDLDELSSLFNRMLERNAGLVAGMREALDNVAHDLRTPLTRLRASAELALRAPDDLNSMREGLGDAMEESDRVLTMLRTLMDISEAETGVMRLERQSIRLDTLAREVTETYDLVADERGVRVVSHLLPASVLGDAGRLRQLIANLVDNAAKYTPRGGLIEVSTRALEQFCEIQVRDTGIGIADDEKPRIFERLYRGDRSRSEPGLGLGLSFVKAICDAHGGTIEVLSALGKGTEVTVSLPRARDASS
jgi:signal transduction histidine kinase